MTTSMELVDRAVDDFLMTGQRVMRAKLTNGVNSSTGTLQLNSVQGTIAEGSLLQIGFELMGVWSVAGADRTVERGDYGSDAAAHAANDLVEIDPIFPRSRVLRSMQSAVLSLSNEPGIWKPTIVTFTPEPGVEMYDLGANDVRQVVLVDQLIDGDWVPLDQAWGLVRGLAGQTGFTGDVGLRLNDFRTGNLVRVVCETPLGSIGPTTSDVEGTTGLSNPTILAVAAALELNSGRAIKRSFMEGQGDARRANEVAPYQTENSSRELKVLYKQLKGEEITRLTQLYPHKRKRR